MYRVTLDTMIENGIPDSRVDFPKSLQEYFQFKDDLYTIDGVILYNARVVVQLTLRQEVLAALHAAHHLHVVTSFWLELHLTLKLYEQDVTLVTVTHRRILVHHQLL